MAAAFAGTLLPMFLQKQFEVSVRGSGRLMSLVVAAYVIGASTGGADADFIFRRTGSLKHSLRGVALAVCSAARDCWCWHISSMATRSPSP